MNTVAVAVQHGRSSRSCGVSADRIAARPRGHLRNGVTAVDERSSATIRD
jgi:hypothetical protein